MSPGTAQLRKAQGLALPQFAELRGVSRSSSRPPKWPLPGTDAQAAVPGAQAAHGVSGRDAGAHAGAEQAAPNPKLQRQAEPICWTTGAKQRFEMEMLDTRLQQAGREDRPQIDLANHNARPPRRALVSAG